MAALVGIAFRGLAIDFVNSIYLVYPKKTMAPTSPIKLMLTAIFLFIISVRFKFKNINKQLMFQCTDSYILTIDCI